MCGSNDHPNAFNFMKSLKSVVSNDFLQAPLSGNCEIDDSYLLDVTSNCETDFPAPSHDIDSDEEHDFVSSDLPLAEVNGLVYIVGWTCRKFLKNHNCEICREYLLDTKKEFDNNNKFFCHFKAQSSSESPFGGLSVPSDSCLGHFKEVELVVRSVIEKVMLSSKISQNLLSHLCNHNFMMPLQLCSTQLVSTIHLIYVRLKIFSLLKWQNRGHRQKCIKKNRKLHKILH